jgi:subtilisin family serine protease
MRRPLSQRLLRTVALAAIVTASPAVAGPKLNAPAIVPLPVVKPPVVLPLPPVNAPAALPTPTVPITSGAAQNPLGGLPPVVSTTLSPLYGTIDPFYGTIDPFYGTIDPFYGTIDPFYGTIDPFYGNIDAFYGSINPFYGNIDAFYGEINPFYGNIDAFWGTINPFYGTIDPFYGTIDPFYGTIDPFDRQGFAEIGEYWNTFGTYWNGQQALWTNPASATELGTRFDGMVADAEALWGSKIQDETGQSFNDAFLAPLLARYGIDPNDPSTLQQLSSTQRNKFFLDWYDGLMGYAGTDRIDHWMRMVNWRPAITQQQGSGADSVIGLLDATADGEADIADNISWSSGYGGFVNGHGAGVASLMVAAHDRKGVMGIAPNATVVAFNPFDQTNTASWGAVREGILALADHNASVINMSLGVAGHTLHQDWRDIFADPQVAAATKDVVFGIAAGNSGTVQTANVDWDFDRDPHMIIVGAVNVAAGISSISNTPGQACLMDGDVCRDLLMNRFMVAPGELILLPDGQGGFVRRSGTSFAAPLVSGAITLLHDRWPWLAKHPDETVEIMFESARDLGAPGVDPVYGHGLLDVEASQSPLNFDNLQFYEVRNGHIVARPAGALRAAGIDTTWQADGVHFQLYEPIGDTFRDFSVPVSTLLVGKVGTLTGGEEYFQAFATGRLTDWIRNGNASFSDVVNVTSTAASGLQLTSSTGRPEGMPFGATTLTEGNAMRSSVRIAQKGFAFTAGVGDGAMALAGQEGLGLRSDYGSQGGVNPMLGLASGGPFMAAELPLGAATSVSFGVTQNRVDHDREAFLSDEDRAAYQGVQDLAATAFTVKMNHRATRNLTFNTTWARVRERNSLLGVQSREQADFAQGAVTDTLTLASTLKVRQSVTLAVAATAARTSSEGAQEQGFATGNDVLSSSFAVSATFQGMAHHGDALRLSVAQPFHVERGELRYNSVQVLDRSTGEIGLADQSFDIGGRPRNFTGELLYAAPILDDAGEVGLFGRAELQSQDGAEINHFAVGGRVNVRF